MFVSLVHLLMSLLKQDPNASSWDFETLRQGCMDGSEPAARELVRRYQTLVWRTVRSHLPYASLQDQDEVVANCFIALLSNGAAALVRYRPAPGFPPEAYIRRQAVMQAMNRYRDLSRVKRKSEVALSPTDDDGKVQDTHADTQLGPEDQLAGQQQLDTLLTALRAELSPALLLTFELLYLRELDPAEVAKVQQVTMDVIYTRKKRIVSVLEATLEKLRTAPQGEPG